MSRIFPACIQDCHSGCYFLLLNVTFENENTLLKVMHYLITVWNFFFLLHTATAQNRLYVILQYQVLIISAYSYSSLR